MHLDQHILAGASLVTPLPEPGGLGPAWVLTVPDGTRHLRVLPEPGSAPSWLLHALRRRRTLGHVQGLAPASGGFRMDGSLAGGVGGVVQPGALVELAAGPIGQDLRAPLAWPELEGVILQILGVLQGLHAHGIVHGDLRAATVELDGAGTIQIRDPGLYVAALREGSVSINALDDSWAPEIRSRRFSELGPWTDLYGLGQLALRHDDTLPTEVLEWARQLLTARGRGLSTKEARRRLECARQAAGQVFPVAARRPTLDLVGRRRAIDVLWDRYTAVRADGRLRVAVIDGALGIGRSALAEQLLQAAQHEDDAVVLRVGYGPMTPAGQGLGRMLADQLRVHRLPDAELRPTLARFLRGAMGTAPPLELESMLGLVRPELRTGEAHDVVVRHAILKLFLESCVPPSLRRGSPKPVILFVEEVQWGQELCGLIRFLTRNPAAVPVLVLMTRLNKGHARLRDERDATRDMLRELGDRGTTVTVGPLSASQVQRLGTDALELSSPLAHQIATCARGNPVHAVQAVLGWREQAMLQSSPRGDVLAPGAGATLPFSLAGVWEARLASALADLSPEAQRCTEVAAFLGMQLRVNEWREIWAGQSELSIDPVLESLADAGLIEVLPETGEVRFANLSLQRTLLERAHREGRREVWNIACAECLRGRGRGTTERRGRHLIWAGALDEGIEALLVAAREALEVGDAERAEFLLRVRDRALDRARAWSDDPRRSLGLSLQARVARHQGRYDEARRAGEAAHRIGRWAGPGPIQGEALLEWGMTLLEVGEVGDALSCFRKAETCFAESEPVRLAESRLSLGKALGALGAVEQSMEAFRAARSMFRKLGDLEGVARCRLGVGLMKLDLGVDAAAIVSVREAMEGFEAARSPKGIASCHRALGDLARRRGDLEEAELRYRHAALLHHTGSTTRSCDADLEVGRVLVLREKYDEAEVVLQRCLEFYERQDDPGRTAACYLLHLPVVASRRNWSLLVQNAAVAAQLTADSGYADADLGYTARLAGERAADFGEIDAALPPLRLALRQYRVLGLDQEASEVSRILRRLEPEPG